MTAPKRTFAKTLTSAKCQYRLCRFGQWPAVFDADADILALDEAGVGMLSRGVH